MSDIYIASDHAGLALKEGIIEFLSDAHHVVIDMGPSTYDQLDDYPDYIFPLVKKITEEKESAGIIIGGSGQGEAIAANRISGIRAAVYYGGPMEVLKLSREHNHANVLSLGARFVTLDIAQEAVRIWLSTPFSQAERHLRRIEKLDHHG